MTMFTSKPPTCAGRTLALPRKDRDIRYLRPLGNSDIARKTREVRVDSRGEGHARRAASVPRAGSDAERVLRSGCTGCRASGSGITTGGRSASGRSMPPAGAPMGARVSTSSSRKRAVRWVGNVSRDCCGTWGSWACLQDASGTPPTARTAGPSPPTCSASLRGRPSQRAVDHRHHLHLDVGGLVVSGGRARPVRAPRRRVGRAAAPADGAGPGGTADGAGAPRARPRPGTPCRSRLPVCRRGLSARAARARDRLFDEPHGGLLGQRRHRELLCDAQDRAHPPPALANAAGGHGRRC